MLLAYLDTGPECKVILPHDFCQAQHWAKCAPVGIMHIPGTSHTIVHILTAGHMLDMTKLSSKAESISDAEAQDTVWVQCCKHVCHTGAGYESSSHAGGWLHQLQRMARAQRHAGKPQLLGENMGSSVVPRNMPFLVDSWRHALSSQGRRASYSDWRSTSTG